MDIKLVIFDCDGTLIDSEYVNNKATSDILTELGHEEFTIDHCISHFAGCSMHDVIDTLKKLEVSKPEEVLERIHKHAMKMAKAKLEPIQNVAETLKQIQIPKAVASNGERHIVVECVKITDLIQYFHTDHIFTRELVKNPKPSPDLYLHVAEEMGNINPRNCLVIEDSMRGITAGKNAGMNVLGFTGGNHHHHESRKELRNAGALAVIENFSELLEYLK